MIAIITPMPLLIACGSMDCSDMEPPREIAIRPPTTSKAPR